LITSHESRIGDLMDEGLTVIEIIGLGIRSEDDAAAFYGELAGKIRNGLVRSKYEALSREEAGHGQMLRGLYRRFAGEEAPHIPGSPAVAEGRGAEIFSRDFEEVLNYAVAREQEAQAFYRGLAKKLAEANARRTVEYLADIERGHELMLKEELEAYRRDRSWYADNPDIQLVGP
jgi:rubrerythrin